MPRTTPYAKKSSFTYTTNEGIDLLFAAYTKSEARAAIKRKLGVGRKSRLLVGSVVRKIHSVSQVPKETEKISGISL